MKVRIYPCFILTFHNVGQGLFYSGVINQKGNQFSFVYDCGSVTLQRNQLEVKIKKFKESLNKNKIDLLIISHFHYDHINGLEFLLNDIYVDTIVMPYMSFTERMLIITAHINKFRYLQIENWFFEFIYDPVLYLLEKGNVRQIILIGKSEDNFSDGENFSPPDGPTDFNPEFPFDHSKLGDDSGNGYLSSKILDENPSWKIFIDNKNLICKTHNGYGLLAGVWLFRFFNFKETIPNFHKRMSDFRKCIKEKFDIDDITNIKKEQILEEVKKTRNNKLKECYKKCIAKKMSLNLTSLSLFHIPVKRTQMIATLGLPSLLSCHKVSFLSSLFFSLFQFPCYINSGHILTGDLDLKSKKHFWEFKNHFQKIAEKVSSFQVPHHGSKKNWNKSLLSLFDKASIWIICAGEKNKYNHPSKTVIYEICQQSRIPIFVNEEYTLQFLGCFY